MQRSNIPGLSRNLLTGAAWGATVAGICLLVGLGRVVIVLLMGRSIASLNGSDIRMLGVYVGGFIGAGMFIGALRPLLHTRAAVYAALAAGGAIVMNTIAIADSGWSGMGRFDWIAMTLTGATFGMAAAYGYLKDSK
jgi:hypothetical protein